MDRADANRLLTEAGITDGLITRSTVYDCNTGAVMVVWEVGRWGPDQHGSVTLGRGRTLHEAMREWQLSKPRGRRGT